MIKATPDAAMKASGQNVVPAPDPRIAGRRFPDAIEWADRALHGQARFVTAMRVKTVACAHLGRLDEARAELGRVLAIDPQLTITRYRGLLAAATSPEVLELLLHGMRVAGLPESWRAAWPLLAVQIWMMRVTGFGASRPLPRVTAKAR